MCSSGHAIIGHEPDGVVYGIHEDPHILDHRQAALRTGHPVQHLVYVHIGSPGIQAMLCNIQQRLAAAVFRQAQHRPGMALGKAIIQGELLLVCGQLQQPQLIGQGRLRQAQPAGCLLYTSRCV